MFEDAPERLDWVRREIAVLELMNHPHIIPLIDVFEIETHIALVFEYAAYGNLHDYSRQGLVIQDAMSMFRQITFAVDYLHSRGFAHRDLKLENVLVCAGRQLKLADFGYAKVTVNGPDGDHCGSPRYAAPEVLSGEEVHDWQAADVWSLGVILYGLTQSRLPWDGADNATVIEKVKMTKLNLPATLPTSARELISGMLMKEVDLRLTVKQVMSHPAFRIGWRSGLPEGYALPDATPGTADRPREAAPEFFLAMETICLGDEARVRPELEADGPNLAKALLDMWEARRSPAAFAPDAVFNVFGPLEDALCAMQRDAAEFEHPTDFDIVLNGRAEIHFERQENGSHRGLVRSVDGSDVSELAARLEATVAESPRSRTGRATPGRGVRGAEPPRGPSSWSPRRPSNEVESSS
jgi:hypothetical protein